MIIIKYSAPSKSSLAKKNPVGSVGFAEGLANEINEQ
jgi:hypothetical protein